MSVDEDEDEGNFFTSKKDQRKFSDDASVEEEIEQANFP
jgi:hypothetical protein